MFTHTEYQPNVSAYTFRTAKLLHKPKVKIRNWDVMPSSMVDRYLKMKLAGACRSLVLIYQTTWHRIPECLNLNPPNANRKTHNTTSN